VTQAEAISFDDVLAARERLKNHIVRTPLLESPLLNDVAGRRILVKAECLQHTGSFKFRGGTSAITKLTQKQRNSGVIAYSSGNHAQGVALAARSAGVQAVIVMPNDAPALKIENTRSYGAEVVLYDRPGGEDREKVGQQLADERGLYLIKPYDNAEVMAGQGTCGLEIAEQAKACGITEADVLVCCGGRRHPLATEWSARRDIHKPVINLRRHRNSVPGCFDISNYKTPVQHRYSRHR